MLSWWVPSSDANLTGANSSGADLSGADLSGADPSGADLSDVVNGGGTVSVVDGVLMSVV